MLLRIQHETKLTYSLPVSETVFEVRMAPPSDEDQTSLSYRLRTTPQAQVTSYRDGFGNRVDLFNVPGSYRELVVLTTSFVRTHRREGIDRLNEARAVWPDDRPASVEAMEFLQPSPLIPRCPELDEFVAGLSLPAGPLAGALTALMGAVASRLKYEQGVTRARTTVAEALALGRGVCQDFAHLTIGACRAFGLPARYVSGYINHPGEVATHAWCHVWAGDQAGWVDIDPTHSEFVADDHVTTAVGRDYHDVPPNRGLWKGRAEESMSVSVKIDPVDRVPIEWNDWNPPSFRPFGSFGSGQSQRQGFPPRASRRTRSPYPNQRSTSPSLVQQQGEQQQQARRADDR
jgi:transglutaminase-like putative cysteine protease